MTALLGQASGGFTESSSALRLMHVGIRNTVGVLTQDSFTQSNPPIVTTAGTVATCPGMLTLVRGVLSGSVAFTRPDAGPNYIGGNIETLAVAGHETLVKPLGVFINNAVGNAFENQPGLASGKGPYVSAQGTYGNRLFETQVLDATSVGGGVSTGDPIGYVTGVDLIASRNGYLMPRNMLTGGGALVSLDQTEIAAQSEHAGAAGSSTLIGVLKVPADSTLNEIVYDQRI